MTEQEWWRDAVVYEVYVRSFADSDGDGVGDLEGIRRRLPHLVELGVDALWLTPFYTSPMHDHGYDVAVYDDVDPLFGTLDDFDRLVAQAHEAGLRIIVDVVPNHTSNEHAWFREALADPASAARARYVFRDGRGAEGAEPPNNWISIFGGPAWTRAPDGQWYLHLFDTSQPDLDWTNREVHEELLRVLRFWLDRGVDGFRIDVAHGLYKRPDLTDEPLDEQNTFDKRHVWDRDEVLAVYEGWRALLDQYDERMMVGEVYLFDLDRIARYVSQTRLHMAFNFTVVRAEWDAAGLRDTVESALQHFSPATWVLSNHDVTRHATRYGGGALGRRRGLAVTALLLALPGSPYLYQGEELGLEEAQVPPDRRQDPMFHRSGGALVGRDGCRTPMPWEAGAPGFGFTAGQPWLPFGPDSAELAADAQGADPASMLSAYRRLLAARRELRARELGDDVLFLDLAPDLVALRRGRLAVVLNTAGEPVQVELAGRLVAATADGAEAADGVVTVPPAATVWLLDQED